MEGASINTGVVKMFSAVDLTVLGVTLAVSLFIGIYFAIKDRYNTNPSEVLIGSGKMAIFPVSLSLCVTFLSALTLLGVPAEVYNYNTMFWWLMLGLVFAIAMSAHIFNPFIYNLGVTSVYEYLEMRFGKMVTVVASLNWIFNTVVYLSFVLYAPSLALQSVTGMNLWVSILTVGGLVTIYTSMGGMKAVLWTDSFQALMIIIALLAVFIQGCIVIGGFPRAWEIADRNSKIYFHDFNPDPGRRHSFWTVVVGGGVMWMTGYSFHQSEVQRIISLPTVRKAQIALWINLAILVIIMFLCNMIGILLAAFYGDCHPQYFNNLITSTDQLLPLFVMDVLGDMKGLPGLFLSCVFSGSLSSLSSGINALAAVTLQDFIRPFWTRPLKMATATIITKLAAAGYGLLIIGCAFLASKLGRVLEVCLTIQNLLDGPLMGVFLLGMFFPRGNKYGALVGYFSGLAFLSWIAFGAFMNGVSTPVSSINTDGCNWNVSDVTAPSLNSSTLKPNSEDEYLSIYRLSYLLYSSVGAIVTVVIGYIVSFLAGRGQPITVDPQLILPVMHVLCPCLPEKVKQVFAYNTVSHKINDGEKNPRSQVETYEPNADVEEEIKEL